MENSYAGVNYLGPRGTRKEFFLKLIKRLDFPTYRMHIMTSENGQTRYAPPRALFVRYPDGRRRKHILPQGHAGIVQLLEDSSSELLLGLLDIKNEVYLCRDEDQGLSGDDGGSGPN